MRQRGNKPVGPIARVLLVLSIVAVLAVIVVGVIAVRRQQAFPARGAASLPGQAAGAGAQPGERPAVDPAIK